MFTLVVWFSATDLYSEMAENTDPAQQEEPVNFSKSITPQPVRSVFCGAENWERAKETPGFFWKSKPAVFSCTLNEHIIKHGIVYYKIRIMWAEKEKVVLRRYREFHKLHLLLLSQEIRTYLAFPPKQSCSRCIKLSDDGLQLRQQALALYLFDVLRSTRGVRNPNVRSFLELGPLPGQKSKSKRLSKLNKSDSGVAALPLRLFGGGNNNSEASDSTDAEGTRRSGGGVKVGKRKARKSGGRKGQTEAQGVQKLPTPQQLARSDTDSDSLEKY